MKNKLFQKSQESWINQLIFPSCHIFYPILGLFLLFLYVAYFGFRLYEVNLNGHTPNWISWWCFAVAAFFVISLWLYAKKWCSTRFIFIGFIILCLTFCGLQYELYKLGGNLISLISICAIVSICCVVKFFKGLKRLKKDWVWMLPVLLVFSYLVYWNISFILLGGVSLFTLLCLRDLRGYNRISKIILVSGAVSFYFAVIFIYCPFNPLYSNNIVGINISRGGGLNNGSLIVKDSTHYALVDAWTGKRIVPNNFDICQPDSIFHSRVIGFKIKDNNIDNFFNSQVKSNIKDNNYYMYPIIMNDTSVLFSSFKEVYNQLERIVKSTEPFTSLTSKLYFDYIEYFNHQTENNVKEIILTYTKLQKELTTMATDTCIMHLLESNDLKLRRLARNLSLGAINALSLDLCLNKEVVSAFWVFSYQFFLTFYETPIYDHVNTVMTFNLDKTVNNKTYIKRTCIISDNELRQLGNFDAWTQISQFCLLLTEAYTVSMTFNSNIAAKLSLSNYDDLSSSKIIEELSKNVNEAKKILEQYQNLNTIRTYALDVQNFYYSCIINEELAEYETFFLNRFKEVTNLILLNEEALDNYKKISDYYQKEFNQGIKHVEDLKLQISILDLLLRMNQR